MTEERKMEEASMAQDLHILYDMLFFSTLGDVNRGGYTKREWT